MLNLGLMGVTLTLTLGLEFSSYAFPTSREKNVSGVMVRVRVNVRVRSQETNTLWQVLETIKSDPDPPVGGEHGSTTPDAVL